MWRFDYSFTYNVPDCKCRCKSSTRRRQYSCRTGRDGEGMKGLGHLEQDHACGEAPSLYKSRTIWQRGEAFSFRCEYCAWLHLACKIENVSGGGALGGRAHQELVLVSVANAWTPSHSQSPQLWTINQLFRRQFWCSSTPAHCECPASVLLNRPFPPIAWCRGDYGGAALREVRSCAVTGSLACSQGRH
jgi:hypothetical protein